MGLQSLFPSTYGDVGSWSPATVATSLAIVLYLGWRVWAFTIVPRLYPERPLAYPYWVPGELLSNQSCGCTDHRKGVGHAVSFLADSNRTIARAR